MSKSTHPLRRFNKALRQMGSAIRAAQGFHRHATGDERDPTDRSMPF